MAYMKKSEVQQILDEIQKLRDDMFYSFNFAIIFFWATLSVALLSFYFIYGDGFSLYFGVFWMISAAILTFHTVIKYRKH